MLTHSKVRQIVAEKVLSSLWRGHRQLAMALKTLDLCKPSLPVYVAVFYWFCVLTIAIFSAARRSLEIKIFHDEDVSFKRLDSVLLSPKAVVTFCVCSA